MSIISGYMVPHPPIAVHEIGRGEEKKIQDTLDAYDAVAKDIARLRPETIIIIIRLSTKDTYVVMKHHFRPFDFLRFLLFL